MKTQIVHHVNRSFTHEVIETRTTFLGVIIKSELSEAKAL